MRKELSTEGHPPGEVTEHPVTGEELRALVGPPSGGAGGGRSSRPPDPEELLAGRGRVSVRVAAPALDRALSSATGHGELGLLRVVGEQRGRRRAGNGCPPSESTSLRPLSAVGSPGGGRPSGPGPGHPLRQGGAGEQGWCVPGEGGRCSCLPQADGQVTLPATLGAVSSLPGRLDPEWRCWIGRGGVGGGDPPGVGHHLGVGGSGLPRPR